MFTSQSLSLCVMPDRQVTVGTGYRELICYETNTVSYKRQENLSRAAGSNYYSLQFDHCDSPFTLDEVISYTVNIKNICMSNGVVELV